jgi:hypothetical protein
VQLCLSTSTLYKRVPRQNIDCAVYLRSGRARGRGGKLSNPSPESWLLITDWQVLKLNGQVIHVKPKLYNDKASTPLTLQSKPESSKGVGECSDNPRAYLFIIAVGLKMTSSCVAFVSGEVSKKA